jgi:hypothetical protein
MIDRCPTCGRRIPKAVAFNFFLSLFAGSILAAALVGFGFLVYAASNAGFEPWMNWWSLWLVPLVIAVVGAHITDPEPRKKAISGVPPSGKDA